MIVLVDRRFRCAICGEPLMRDGGNRLQPGQAYQTFMCINGAPLDMGGHCGNFGIRLRMPLEYLEVEQG